MTAGRNALFDDAHLEREIRGLLAETYKPEGVNLWIAHARNQEWSYERCLPMALGYIEGNFS